MFTLLIIVLCIYAIKSKKLEGNIGCIVALAIAADVIIAYLVITNWPFCGG